MLETICNGVTHATEVDTTRVLKQAIIGKFERDSRLSCRAEQILLSIGAGSH